MLRYPRLNRPKSTNKVPLLLILRAPLCSKNEARCVGKRVYLAKGIRGRLNLEFQPRQPPILLENFAKR